MGFRLSRQQQQQLVDWAQEAGDLEICGLILGGAEVLELRPCANVAADPSRHFEVDPAALIEAEREARSGGAPIIGYFHSHPNGLAAPSATDEATAAADGRIWLIIADGGVTAWQKPQESGFERVSFVIEG